jgi:5-methylcytosine-specific restriction endonuclease McrA
MLRTKITELGKLTLLDDGGLVCSVILQVGPRHPPPLDAFARAASLYWASTDPTELSVGDMVVHSEHGVARYMGRKSINHGNGEKEEYLLLEYAHGNRFYVPPNRSYLVQKLRGADCQVSTLRDKGLSSGKWPQSYCAEVLPNAYGWPGIGTFPEFPQEPMPRPGNQAPSSPPFSEALAEWRRACATYLKTLHENESYRQAAQEYFERQSREPQPLLVWWAYRAIVLRVEPTESANAHNRDEHLLSIKQYVLHRERSIEKVRREVEALESCENLEDATREPIPEHVRLFVWRRDKGQCVRCGSKERLEFDHIIPVVAGGSNTERNIQLLCESCNRSKSATV